MHERSAAAPEGTSRYRLAPAVLARLLGAGLVAVAVVAVVGTVLVVALDLSPDVLVALVAAALLVAVGGAAWLRGVDVVRLDDAGYRVRLVRGTGVGEGRWTDVEEASAAHPRGVPCVVLERRDGTSTSIPVGLLGADREAFADEVRARLERAHAG